MFYFYKEGKVQEFVHKLKYNRKAQVGEQPGREFGNACQKSTILEKTDLLIPIPLHPKREFKRGYNQSAYFAEGLAESMQIPFLKDGLIRKVNTDTQTQKNRMERWQNVEAAFVVNNPKTLKGKRVLLVDDVVTTGATLEACSHKLLNLEGTSVCVDTIAYAYNF